MYEIDNSGFFEQTRKKPPTTDEILEIFLDNQNSINDIYWKEIRFHGAFSRILAIAGFSYLLLDKFAVSDAGALALTLFGLMYAALALFRK